MNRQVTKELIEFLNADRSAVLVPGAPPPQRPQGKHLIYFERKME
jgi:hypothetical protein